LHKVNSTFIKIIDQFSETNVEAIVNGTDVDNSNEYEPNQNVSNSNSEENLKYYNDTSVNSNHVVVDVNKSIVCNEIETSVGNVNFKYDFNISQVLVDRSLPFFLNIDFFSCKQHFATLYVSLEDIYTINTIKQ
jgi:hypothetical protein